MKFKQIRKQKGLTLQAVADNIGCSVKTLLRIESGERVPKADTLFRLASIYGVKTDDFYGEPDPPYAPRARSKGSGASSKH
jgi:transcriptional regulator with XRE-family HTH domain